MLINLHKDFDIFKFPAGEVHVRLKEGVEAKCFKFTLHNTIVSYTLFAKLQNSDDIISLFLAVDALKRTNININKIFIPYIPYGRQDRAANYGEALSLKVMCNMLNGLNIPILTLDTHSGVTGALLDSVEIISRKKLFLLTMQKHSDLSFNEIKNDYHIICPDTGALKQTYGIAQELEISKIYCCNKHRDTLSGELKIDIDYTNWGNKKCIIIDDICDGGGTFNGIASRLKECGAEEVLLYVTHGVFSQGFDKLLENIDKIFTTNSYKEIEENDFVKVYDVENLR